MSLQTYAMGNLDPNGDLRVPDGRLVSHVRRIELYQILQRLGIPGLSASQVKDEMIACYR